MQNLNFNDGLVRFAINGDESRVITINPTDFGIINRFSNAQTELDKLSESYEDNEKNNIEAVAELDKKAREIIDHIVGSPVSDIVFGDVNCLSLSGGQPIFVNFLEAYKDYLEPKIKAEMKKSKARVAKYTKQVK